MGELARIAAMSPRNLTRLFREATGITIKAYSGRVKTQVAQDLLRNPRLTLDSVAESCGFKDPRQFRRLLQAERGRNPFGVETEHFAPRRALEEPPMIAFLEIPCRLLVLSLVATASPAPAKEPARYTRNVAIVLYEGVELLDFAGPGEVFGAASGFGGAKLERAFNVYTVAVSKDALKSRFLTMQPEYSIDDAPKPDVIVIPGGNTDNLLDNAKFMAWLKAAQPKTEVTLTVCTGAFTVAKLGLLDGKQVTTFYGAIDGLREQAPKAIVIDGRRFVDNGSIITTAGVSAGIDGALHTVARLLGRSVADQTARYMEYHWTPEPYLAKNYTYLNPSLDEAGRRLQQAQIFEDEKNYAEASKAYRAMTVENPKDGFAWYRLGTSLQAAGRLDDAVDASRRAAEFEDVRPNALFNLACAYALQGKPDAALNQLETAVAAGFKAKWALNGDPDLASIRSDARFKKIVAAL